MKVFWNIGLMRKIIKKRKVISIIYLSRLTGNITALFKAFSGPLGKRETCLVIAPTIHHIDLYPDI